MKKSFLQRLFGGKPAERGDDTAPVRPPDDTESIPGPSPTAPVGSPHDTAPAPPPPSTPSSPAPPPSTEPSETEPEAEAPPTQRAPETEPKPESPDQASPEALCGIDPASIDPDQLRGHLAALYRRHNAAAASLKPELREEAERMLDAIVICRRKYLEGGAA